MSKQTFPNTQNPDRPGGNPVAPVAKAQTTPATPVVTTQATTPTTPATTTTHASPYTPAQQAFINQYPKGLAQGLYDAQAVGKSGAFLSQMRSLGFSENFIERVMAASIEGVSGGGSYIPIVDPVAVAKETGQLLSVVQAQQLIGAQQALPGSPGQAALLAGLGIPVPVNDAAQKALLTATTVAQAQSSVASANVAGAAQVITGKVSESKLDSGGLSGKSSADAGLVKLVNSGASIAEIQAYLQKNPSAATGSYAYGILGQVQAQIAQASILKGEAQFNAYKTLGLIPQNVVYKDLGNGNWAYVSPKIASYVTVKDGQIVLTPQAFQSAYEAGAKTPQDFYPFIVTQQDLNAIGARARLSQADIFAPNGDIDSVKATKALTDGKITRADFVLVTGLSDPQVNSFIQQATPLPSGSVIVGYSGNQLFAKLPDGSFRTIVVSQDVANAYAQASKVGIFDAQGNIYPEKVAQALASGAISKSNFALITGTSSDGIDKFIQQMQPLPANAVIVGYSGNQLVAKLPDGSFRAVTVSSDIANAYAQAGKVGIFDNQGNIDINKSAQAIATGAMTASALALITGNATSQRANNMASAITQAQQEINKITTATLDTGFLAGFKGQPYSAQLLALANAISASGIEVYPTGGYKNSDGTLKTLAEVAVSKWNAMTSDQQAQVASIYGQDLYRTNLFSEFTGMATKIQAEAGVIAGALGFAPITAPLAPIGKWITLPEARQVMSQTYAIELVAVKPYVNANGTVDTDRLQADLNSKPDLKSQVLSATGYGKSEDLVAALNNYNNNITVSKGEIATGVAVGALDVLSLGIGDVLMGAGQAGKIAMGGINLGSAGVFMPSAIQVVRSPETSISEKAFAIGGEVLLGVGGVAAIRTPDMAKLSPVGKVEVPLREGGGIVPESPTVWKGIKIGDNPLVGVSRGALTIGTKGIEFPPLDQWQLPKAEGTPFEPRTGLETKVLVNSDALVKAGMTAPDAAKFVGDIQSTLGEVRQFYGKESPYMNPELLTKPIQTLSQDGVISTLKYLKDNSNVVEKSYGSSTMPPQLDPAKIAEWVALRGKEPADIDIQLKGIDAVGAQKFTSMLVDRLQVTEGTNNVRISAKSPTLIETLDPITGKWAHAVDIHYQNEPSPMASLSTGEMVYGMVKSKPAVTVDIEGIGKIKIARLSETGVGKTEQVLGWRIDPETGNVILRTEAHRLKDYPDLYEIIKTFNGEQAADRWATKLGLDLEPYKTA